MNTHWLATNALASLLLPPMGLVLLGTLGWWMARHRLYLGGFLMFLSVLLLIGLSTDAGSRALARTLEQQTLPLIPVADSKAQAIVILGGGRLHAAPDADGRDQVGPITLMRLRAGARLQRQTGLPVLVAGGAPDGSGESEARLMERTLKEDFRVPVRWIEDKSGNTAGNAILSSPVLYQAGIRRILLVTDAMHMPRARLVFERAGLEVVPMPTNFVATQELSLASFIPHAQALRHSHYALHEWLGLLWYQISYGAAI